MLKSSSYSRLLFLLELEWEIDYVKNDACYPQTPNIKGGGINQNQEGVGFLLYARFFAALQASGRPIFFSIENPSNVAPAVARNVSNSRRVGGDIGDGFGATVGEFHTAPNASVIGCIAGASCPGFFNDLVGLYFCLVPYCCRTRRTNLFCPNRSA